MKSIVILGAGMVGKAIAADLSKEYKALSVDVNEEALSMLEKKYGIAVRKADVANKEALNEITSDCDLVVSAVPGFLGYRVLNNIIESGKNVVDISFFPEDPLSLDALAKKNKVTAIVDAGVAPGMDNFILGYHDARMKVEKFECLVGGLPKKPVPPFFYKAPFSPIDVIEEYTRPARFVKNRKQVIKPALTDAEDLVLPRAGKLTAINTDGLRTLLTTMPHIPDMIEKTLRYKEHLSTITLLRDAGFFDTKEISIGKNKISPLSLTAGLLIDHWRILPGEKEFTVMRVTITGKEHARLPCTRTAQGLPDRQGKRKKIIYDLFDEYDKKTGFSSMARTTGYTCTAAANLVLKGLFSDKGISPMEYVGKDESCFNYVLEYLNRRGVTYNTR